ncbi:hypothetical protein FQA47_011769 [Oryzias melastigma]|uniref:Uncharacterized protein n=1 Tax=Oryzias melastigma TaxID=30732 RepID=A0A834FNL5_ORYME|nr:hypothetical protein FQA47_011769 [Oryzias melastigma]
MEPTESQNVWHPVSVTKKKQQKREQPEVENETGYRQMMGGRVTAALDAQDHGMVTCAFLKSISSPSMMLSRLLLPAHCANKQQSSGSRDCGTSMSRGMDPAEMGGPELEQRERKWGADDTAATQQPAMRLSGLLALPLYCTAAQALTSSQGPVEAPYQHPPP